MEGKTIQFKDLAIGDEFECWGDHLINYDTPTLCKCIKTDYDRAEEIGGIGFYVNQDSEVFINN